jgi:hypothetical protein
MGNVAWARLFKNTVRNAETKYAGERGVLHPNCCCEFFERDVCVNRDPPSKVKVRDKFQIHQQVVLSRIRTTKLTACTGTDLMVEK